MLSEHLRGGLSFASQRYVESSAFKDRTTNENEGLDLSMREILIDIDANK